MPRIERQREDKGYAPLGLVGGADLPAVGFYRQSAERQAQSIAPRFVIPGRELLKETVLNLGTQRGTVVIDRDPRGVLLMRRRNPDESPFRCELRCVAQQIIEHAHKNGRVCPDFRHFMRDYRLKAKRLLGQHQVLGRFFDDLPEYHRLFLKLDPLCLQFAYLQDRIDEFENSVGVGPRDIDDFLRHILHRRVGNKPEGVLDVGKGIP